MVMTYKKGRAQYVWKVKKGIKRNEPLDIRNYATAALEITNPILKKEIPESTNKPQRNIRSRGLGR